MPSRIEVELTSARDDGTWTWRAAGARQPKGSLDGKLLYHDARVGDVVRADAEFGLDGVSIVHLYPPKARRSEPERVELLGPAGDAPAVTSSLVPKSGRPRREGPAGPGRPGRPPGPGGSGPNGRRPFAGREAGGPGRGDGPGTGDRSPGTAGSGSPGSRPGRPPRGSGPGTSRRGPHRLSPANTHRAAALASVAPEQRPVAEQVLRGGLPAVRQAIDAQNAAAKSEGRAAIRPEPLLAMAEELLPRLKAAAWRDRADAALAAGDSLALRDLRSVVMGADSAGRDEESRLLASQLREALDRRVAQLRQRWVDEVEAGLAADKVLRALRASARPPDPGARFPAELAVRLSHAAGAAMTPETPADRWTALLEAVAGSPVRRTVKPSGLPQEPGDSLLAMAKQESGRVPALAGLLGIDMPPPPGPPRPVRAGSGSPRRPGSGRPSRRSVPGARPGGQP
ncbi:MAG: hypothetical protein ACRD0J_15930, partial [Acidimicrobiales bacterium]